MRKSNDEIYQLAKDPSSLAKGYDLGLPSLHPWRI